MGTTEPSFERPRPADITDEVVDQLRRGADPDQLEELGYFGASEVDPEAIEAKKDVFDDDGVLDLDPKELDDRSEEIDAAELRHPSSGPGYSASKDTYEDLDKGMMEDASASGVDLDPAVVQSLGPASAIRLQLSGRPKPGMVWEAVQLRNKEIQKQRLQARLRELRRPKAPGEDIA